MTSNFGCAMAKETVDRMVMRMKRYFIDNYAKCDGLSTIGTGIHCMFNN
jgi:hypothetical protein